jgi:hypothetical protein
MDEVQFTESLKKDYSDFIPEDYCLGSKVLWRIQLHFE